MISWEEYIKSNILEFRRLYEFYPHETRELIERDHMASLVSLSKPCQVAVIVLKNPFLTCLFIAHSKRYPDMETIVLEDIEFDLFLVEALKDSRLSELVGIKDITDFAKWIKKEIHERWMSALNSWKKTATFSSKEDFRSSEENKLFIAHEFYSHMELVLSHMWRERQRKRIEKTVEDIKRDAKAIPVAELRTKMIEATDKLEGQIEQLGEQYKGLREEVGGVRRLIGTSEKFLEWKAFTSDFEHIKETHITKEAFDAHVKRLDEKIEKGLEALHTRIEDLKAVRFWSKRTILEIALVIWGTIVTLIAAGIIKF